MAARGAAAAAEDAGCHLGPFISRLLLAVAAAAKVRISCSSTMTDARCTYEELRLRNMAANSQKLQSLGIAPFTPTTARPPPPRQKKRGRESQPTRESLRARSLPVPVYAQPLAQHHRRNKLCRYDPGQEEASARVRRKSDIADGSRDGLWSGERFGEVARVPVGMVFGAGDYQRLGRQEMMDSGFFRPFVTPEWCAPGVGCYSLILNNDNGASRDSGDVILYAGSGGRRRGQNRTAPQSFDQDWSNVTNAALRLNHERQQPVRVVRGPKLQGGFGTSGSGGGYRYDGLYRVASAKMERLQGCKYLTAVFELRRV